MPVLRKGKEMEEKEVVIRIRHLSKEYRLGVIGRGTLQRDLQSWWARKRGKPDPNQRIGRREYTSKECFYALEDVSFDASEIKSFTANYKQNKAAKILIYSGKSGMNIYDIKFTPAKVSNGISNINVDSAKAGKTYNMAGQQVSSSFKGLVIKNGKKFVK